MPGAALNRGMVVEIRVGQSLEITPTTQDGARIVLTVEAKHGQRARVRVQSDRAIKVVTPRDFPEASNERTLKLAEAG